MAEPSMVCAASLRARSLGSPIRTPPSARASMIMNMYAGELPLNPVTASILSSDISNDMPIAFNMDSTIVASSLVALVPKVKLEAPSSTVLQTLGITRTNLQSGTYFSKVLILTPAATLMMSFFVVMASIFVTRTSFT